MVYLNLALLDLSLIDDDDLKINSS